MRVGNDKEKATLDGRMDNLQKLVEQNQKAIQKDMMDVSKRLEARPMASTAGAASTMGTAATNGLDEGGHLRRLQPQHPTCHHRATSAAIGEEDPRQRVGRRGARRPTSAILDWLVWALASSTGLGAPLHAGDAAVGDYVQVNGAKLRMWAMLQKPKDIRDRNKKLIRLAAVPQSHLHDKSMIVENFKVNCWRSASVVVAGRKILTVTDTQMQIENDWCDDKIWDGEQATIEEELRAASTE